MSKDALQRFVFEQADIRGAVVTLEKEFAEMTSSQVYSEGEKYLLGEFAAAVVLLVNQLKFEGTLALQVRQGASVGLIVVECSDQYTFRGTIHDAVENLKPAAALDQVCDGGILSMTISPSEGHSYQGIVPLQGSDLAECLMAYFQQSEQLPSWFRFAISEKKAVGIMLQALPPQICCEPEETTENWDRAVHLASTLTQEEMLNLDHEEVLYRLYHEESVQLFPIQPVQYHCQCSIERMERGLLTLGPEELEEIIEDQANITTQCHFCGKTYHFSDTHIRALIQGAGPYSSH